MRGRILIIGKGYIGNKLADNFNAKNISTLHISRADIDYTDETLFELFIRDNPDILGCVNCSGYTGRPNVDTAEKEKDKCYLLNVKSPLCISSVCERYSIRYYHLSTGCIYTGYGKLYTEEDAPNFGRGNPDASWYSKTKHVAEEKLKTTSGYCIRLRMPFSGFGWYGGDYRLHDKDLVGKLLRYDTLVNALNTKTYIPDLIGFIYDLVMMTVLRDEKGFEIYNFGCDDPLDTKSFTEVMRRCGYYNKDWAWADWSDLDIVANRSNCILSMAKIKDMGFRVRSEEECLLEALNA